MTKLLTKDFWLGVYKKKLFGTSIIDILGIFLCVVVSDAVLDLFALTGILSFFVHFLVYVLILFLYAAIIYIIYNYILK